MQKWFQYSLSVLVSLIVVSASHESADASAVQRLSDQVKPTHYQLEFDINPRKDFFTGVAQISVVLSKAMDTIELHGQELKVSEAIAEGSDGQARSAVYSQSSDGGVSTLTFDQTLTPGEYRLRITFSASFNDSLEGLYKARHDELAYAYTQFQPLSARLAFPGFDEPRFKTPFDVSIVTHGDDIAVSNGPVAAIEDLAPVDGMPTKRYRFNTTAPLPTYLVALAVGDFDVVQWKPIPANEVRDRKIALRGIAPKGQGEDIRYALKHTAEMLKILEDYFDVAYPYQKLDLIAASEFRSGGMENAGAIMYAADRILIGNKPSPYRARRLAWLHAHELAHSWFGNLVTPAWWDDLWLNEAFAVWMAGKVLREWKPKQFSERGIARGAHRALWSDRLGTARRIRQPINSEHDISNAFDSITYSKGGSVLSMIERYVGEDVLREGVRRHIDKHRHGVATSDDFFQTLETTSGGTGSRSVFESFVEQAGAPFIELDWACEVDGETKLNMRQSRSTPLGSSVNQDQTWEVPVCVGVIENGKRVSQCHLLTEQSSSMTLKTSACPDWVIPNESAAAYGVAGLSGPRWDALLDNFDQLDPKEQIAAFGSLRAGYQSGAVSTSVLLRASGLLAQSPFANVAELPVGTLHRLKLKVVGDSNREEFQGVMRRLYDPVIKKFAYSSRALKKEPRDREESRFRTDLFWFMAMGADHGELRQALSAAGQKLVGYGGNGEYKKGVVSKSLEQLAITAALYEQGLPFADFLIEKMSDDPDRTYRSHIVRALGFQTDPKVFDRVWQLILEGDVGKREAYELLRRQSFRVDNASEVKRYIFKHYDRLAQRIPKSNLAWLPWRLVHLCEPSARKEIASFFEPKVKETRGGPRALANVLEEIDICIAIKDAHQADVKEAIAEYSNNL